MTSLSLVPANLSVALKIQNLKYVIDSRTFIDLGFPNPMLADQASLNPYSEGAECQSSPEIFALL